MLSNFSIYRTQQQQYHFRLLTLNGNLLLEGGPFQNMTECRNTITAVKLSAAIERRYDRRTTPGNLFFFVLNTCEGQVIGQSDYFDSVSAREKVINSVKQQAAGAGVIVNSQ